MRLIVKANGERPMGRSPKASSKPLNRFPTFSDPSIAHICAALGFLGQPATITHADYRRRVRRSSCV
jgi:hypothetical protein